MGGWTPRYVSVWNAGKVTSTECKGRQRDPYKQETLATRTANRSPQQRHKPNTRSVQIQNNSNNLLSTNVLLCFSSCKHQQLLMRHQRLSPRYGSDQQPDLAQGTVCLTESQRARIRVTELVWSLRVPNTAGGAFCSHLVCMSTCMGCTREGGYPGSNVYRGVTIALRRGGG